jgi:peptidoglycan-N-acetylglucosamine deacetylase
MPQAAKPLAGLSLDLDNRWSYMKTHGDRGWESFPSYLELLVPRVLRMLEESGLKITFFIVGQDAALDINRGPLRTIADAGHEVGNHSFRHEQWLHKYSRRELEDDIATAEEHIERATGQRPVGFRGPGYSLSSDMLDVLAQRGYVYDASTFPTFIGPLARAYYFRAARLSAAQRAQRAALFGGLADVARPVAPYRWRVAGSSLLEIPVTTVPFLRLPFHLSYILYLSALSPEIALGYLRAALYLCRLVRTPPSFLLHPLDFLGCDDGVGLEFFPAMRMEHRMKCDLARRAVELLRSQFEVLCLGGLAAELLKNGGLPIRSPSLRPRRGEQVG